LLYVEGRVRKLDEAKAVEWLQKAAEQDHAQAQYDLAAMYAEGAGIAKDPIKAVEWTGRAAELGHATAQLEYAIMKFNGRGIERDEAGAIALLKSSSAKGNPVAQNRLARIYANGMGVKKDPLRAAKWHLIARDAGVSDFKLDLYLAKMSEPDRAKAKADAQAWMKKQSER
ncbi:MAG: sel1 repeat family protein, partial [Hyphomicrobiaceae bacterium]|nr:sel1 repeat family protein [Hyphomicrobiaceae bacterium]